MTSPSKIGRPAHDARGALHLKAADDLRTLSESYYFIRTPTNLFVWQHKDWASLEQAPGVPKMTEEGYNRKVSMPAPVN